MLPAGRSLYRYKIVRFPPAFLISQKSKIFDSFSPGEAMAAALFAPINDHLSSPIPLKKGVVKTKQMCYDII